MQDKQYCDRRSLLASASIFTLGGLAGCFSGAEPENAAQQGSPNTTDQQTPTQTQSQNQSQGGNVPKSALTTSNTRVLTVDGDVVGEVAITNEGNARTDSYRVGMDWLDEQGNYLATSDIDGVFHESGETWVARKWAWLELENPEQVASVEASVTETDPWGQVTANPQDIEIVNQTLRASEQEVLVRGTLRNTGQTTKSPNVATKVFDASGTILGMGGTTKEVPAGSTARFEISPDTYGRDGQVESASLIPYTVS